MIKSTADIRQEFLNFFHNKGHKIIPGSSLIPNNDLTLMITNAGMNQFKNVFLGFDKRDYSRATTAQCCVRAGGKHNDLSNVGYTTRHHTFFEMLGNFSFGDYFKREAIRYAWELLTDKHWFNLMQDRLWVTVYATDNESYEIWKNDIGIPNKHIIRIGDNHGAQYMSDNFWHMGDTGPCGPCTEIFYDHGSHIYGNPPGSGNDHHNGERYIEIWNIVFMQFNRHADGTMELLPKPSVDTGMGLERIAAILQHTHSNYDIDLFRKLISFIAQIIGVNDLNHKSLRVIADHIRSCAFLIADGVIPSNEHCGYVLRRIIRRAIRHGNILGTKETFFYKLVEPLIEVMGDMTCSNLKYQKIQVEQVLKIEEELFANTLKRGLKLLNEALTKLSGTILHSKTAFRLYDTYGLPLDLIIEVCRDHNITVDESGFNIEMQKQRHRARKSKYFNIDYNTIIHTNHSSIFHGYDRLELGSSIVSLFVEGNSVTCVHTEQEAIVFLNETPFYAESGGQVGDQGELKGDNFNFKVYDTQKYNQSIGHIGKLIHGVMKINDYVYANVDKVRRTYICLNHSATHLMHAALRKVLGDHVKQKGSLVNDKILRFDFSHFQAMTIEEIHAVENLVNVQIRHNLLVETHIMSLDLAKSRGAITLFNKEYSNDCVRVLNMGDFSIELCGGTHVTRTGDIGLFHIISESSISSGIRRIEAITGDNAITTMRIYSDQLHCLTHLLKCNNQNLHSTICTILSNVDQLKKELQQLKKHTMTKNIANLTNKTINVKGIKVLINQLTNIDTKMLLLTMNALKNRIGHSSIIVLAAIIKYKISLIVSVSNDITDRIQAKELINIIIQQIDGKGGGCAHTAQAVGNNIAALSDALNNITNWINTELY